MTGTAPYDFTPPSDSRNDPESKASNLLGQLAPVPYEFTSSLGSRQDLESKNSSVVAWPEADNDHPSIPTSLWAEGGFLGCLTLFGGFVGSFATMGQVSSFGTYQAWYLQHQLSAYSPSEISWIGGLQLWIMMFSVSRLPLVNASLHLRCDIRVDLSVAYSTPMDPRLCSHLGHLYTRSV
jgi:hypothetical protein